MKRKKKKSDKTGTWMEAQKDDEKILQEPKPTFLGDTQMASLHKMISIGPPANGL